MRSSWLGSYLKQINVYKTHARTIYETNGSGKSKYIKLAESIKNVNSGDQCEERWPEAAYSNNF
jgi:hypothetical protein